MCGNTPALNSLQATLISGVLMWCIVFSYFAYIACEAPVAALDRLAFGRLTARTSNRRQERQEELEGGDLKMMNGRGEGNEVLLGSRNRRPSYS
ncbi:hypothetical protein MTO96_019753 [Rhipicephalus appendiculatus]